MKTSEILIAGGVFAGAALLVMRAKKVGVFGGDAERMSGVKALYGASAGQQAGISDAVIRDNWASMELAFRTQPDFWV